MKIETIDFLQLRENRKNMYNSLFLFKFRDIYIKYVFMYIVIVVLNNLLFSRTCEN